MSMSMMSRLKKQAAEKAAAAKIMATSVNASVGAKVVQTRKKAAEAASGDVFGQMKTKATR